MSDQVSVADEVIKLWPYFGPLFGAGLVAVWTELTGRRKEGREDQKALKAENNAERRALAERRMDRAREILESKRSAYSEFIASIETRMASEKELLMIDPDDREDWQDRHRPVHTEALLRQYAAMLLAGPAVMDEAVSYAAASTRVPVPEPPDESFPRERLLEFSKTMKGHRIRFVDAAKQELDELEKKIVGEETDLVSSENGEK